MNHHSTPQIRSILHKHYSEYHITLHKWSERSGFLADLIAHIESKKMRVGKVIALGNVEKLFKCMPAMKKYPLLFISNSPSATPDIRLDSLHLQLFEGTFDRFEFIQRKEKNIGFVFEYPSHRALTLHNITNGDTSVNDFLQEARGVYGAVDDILSQHDFSPKDIYRSWNFLSRITRTYAPFNQARNEYFSRHSIEQYPAATGIEAGLSNGKSFMLGLEAIQGRGINVETVSSDLQCEACDYGPKFSRAVRVSSPEDSLEKLYISGTSSVNIQGTSILQDDPEENVKYVLLCVQHLLEKNKMSLQNIVTSYLYFKNDVVYGHFLRLYTKEGWSFPYNPVFTEICRDNFIFEMECLAANKVEPIDHFPNTVI